MNRMRALSVLSSGKVQGVRSVRMGVPYIEGSDLQGGTCIPGDTDYKADQGNVSKK